MTSIQLPPQTVPWPDAAPFSYTETEAFADFTARGIPGLVSEFLIRRGFPTPDTAIGALGGTFEDHQVSPDRLPDIGRAAALTVQAIAEARPICVRGDFDADGVLSTAVLVRGLVQMGATVTWSVPHRQRDGRELTPEQATSLAPKGGLFITVDHGTNSHEALQAALAKGADVIVLDHHRPQGTLLPNVLFVNPHRPDCRYPLPDVCATTIAWHFLAAVAEARGQDMSCMDWAADLVAIATLADSMPLLGENRALVRDVLPDLPKTRHLGLRALLTAARLNERPTLSARDVIFDLVPHLNAPGRVGDPADAVRLLLANDPVQASALGSHLAALNDHRRALEERVLTQAWPQAQQAPADAPAVVLQAHDWHPGVTSIVAARVADRMGKPCLVLLRDGDFWKGTARSGRSGADVFSAVQSGAAYLTAWGGHREATGLTVPALALEAFLLEFQSAIAEAALSPRTAGKAAPDIAEPLTGIPREMAVWLEELGPFGQGFKAPRVVVIGTSGAINRCGIHRNHLDGALTLADGTSLQVWGPRLADEYPPELLRGGTVAVLGTLDLHRGRVRLVAESLAPVESAATWAA